MIQCQYNRITPVTSQYTFSRASGAYGTNGRYRHNNDMRLYPDPWGRMRAVLIEEGITNLLSASESQGFSSPITKTVTSGTNYTVSMTGSGSITLSGAGSGTVTASSPVTFTASSTSLTLTPSGDVGEVQLIAKSYPLTWVLGGVTRAHEYLYIPSSVLNLAQGTIECYFKLFTLPPNNYNVIFATTNLSSPGPRLLIRRDYTGTLTNKLAVYDGDGTTEVSFGTVSAIQANVWYYMAFTWGSNGRKLYLNGSLENSNSLSRQIYTNPQAQVGYWSGGFACGLIADLRISSIARSDAEIAVAYSSGQPLPVDQYTTFKLYPKRAKMLVV